MRGCPGCDAGRGGPAREIQARAGALDFAALPERAETRLAGLLLAIPDLIALGVPEMVAAAGYPSTPKIPALSCVLSLLTLKLTSTRRVSHVYDIAADPGAALFAGLTALPKATALTTYSYRLEHSRQAAFLAALDKASLAAALATGEALNLDFHAVMAWASHCSFADCVGQNRPVWAGGGSIRRPFARPARTWTACSSPRLTRCNRVWRETPWARVASRTGSQLKAPNRCFVSTSTRAYRVVCRMMRPANVSANAGICKQSSGYAARCKSMTSAVRVR